MPPFLAANGCLLSAATVKMFELKLNQRAKPGKGGILPAAKATPQIAKIRGSLPTPIRWAPSNVDANNRL